MHGFFFCQVEYSGLLLHTNSNIYLPVCACFVQILEDSDPQKLSKLQSSLLFMSCQRRVSPAQREGCSRDTLTRMQQEVFHRSTIEGPLERYCLCLVFSLPPTLPPSLPPSLPPLLLSSALCIYNGEEGAERQVCSRGSIKRSVFWPRIGLPRVENLLSPGEGLRAEMFCY